MVGHGMGNGCGTLMPGPATNGARAYKRLVETSSQQVAKAGALALAKGVRARLKRDAGGNNSLSGVPAGKLTVKVGTVRGNVVARVAVEAGPRKALGIWSWLESGTRRHEVGVRGKRKGQRMRMPDGRWATGPFTAGGSRPKRTWSRGVEESVEDCNAAQERAWASL